MFRDRRPLYEETLRCSASEPSSGARETRDIGLDANPTGRLCAAAATRSDVASGAHTAMCDCAVSALAVAAMDRRCSQKPVDLGVRLMSGGDGGDVVAIKEPVGGPRSAVAARVYRCR